MQDVVIERLKRPRQEEDIEHQLLSAEDDLVFFVVLRTILFEVRVAKLRINTFIITI